MSLAFFYPLAWLGALALAAPLWLHLHRRHESNVVWFSALQFLEDQPVARRRPLWPRDLPLLLLRLLAVLLLAAAFAWPYLPLDEQPQLVTESVVYVLDNTLSHQADGQFERARDAVAGELRGAGAGRQTAVVVLDALPRVLAGFQDAPDVAAQRVAELSPTISRGSYLAALRQADELLQQSLGASRRIELYTDHQDNQWREGHDVTPFLANVDVRSGSPAPAKALPSLAVWNPRAQRLQIGDKMLVQCVVQVFHQGPAAEAELELLIDGQTLGRRTIALLNQPEIVRVAVEWDETSESWLRGEVRLSGTPDALEADNRAFFSLPPRRPGTLDVAVDSRFLGAALEPDVLRGRWHVQVLQHGDKNVSQNDPSDVLVVEVSRLASEELRERLLAQLNGGRGVLLIVDQVPAAVEGFLRQLGLECGKARTLPPEQSAIRYYYAEHPLFVPFQSGEFGDLSLLRVYRYVPLQAEQGVPLMFAADGEPILWQLPAAGTLLVAGFGLDRECTDWPLLTSFVPFVDMCCGIARPSPPSLEAYQPGETCVWPTEGPGQVALRDEAGQTVVTAEPANGAARLELPEQAGLYTVHYGGADEPAGMIQVNPSPDESRLTYTDPTELIARCILPTPEDETPLMASAAPPSSEAGILRQRVWWWCLLGGIALLCVETCWLAWRKEQA